MFMNNLLKNTLDLEQALNEFDSEWKPLDENYIYASGIENVKLRDYQIEGIDWVSKRLAFRAFLASTTTTPTTNDNNALKTKKKSHKKKSSSRSVIRDDSDDDNNDDDDNNEEEDEEDEDYNGDSNNQNKSNNNNNNNNNINNNNEDEQDDDEDEQNQPTDMNSSTSSNWKSNPAIAKLPNDFGIILGDEMGLGKTLQSICILSVLNTRRLKKFTNPPNTSTYTPPALVIVPLSLLDNWKLELEKFAPHLNVVLYTGPKEERESLRMSIKKRIKQARQNSENNNDTSTNINVLLTTVDLCIKEPEFFQSIVFSALIVDEAHRLKNRESVLYNILQEVVCCFKLLLTGTPVQNNLNELFSLLRFVAPSIFPEKISESFIDYFDQVSSDSTRAAKLHSILKKFMLRREKSQVAAELPRKEEIVLHCGLTDLQKKYYKAILKKDVDAFANPTKTRLSNILMELRKCVNHPYLFEGVEPEPFQIGEHLVDASAKLKMLDHLLPFLKTRGHKVLIFSQMTRVLDILQDYLQYRGFNYERLDGSVRGEERFLAIKSFNKSGNKPSSRKVNEDGEDEDENSFVFLLSTRAGGLGLNLVSADTVIFYDSDFNPQSDLQAAARAHRIGQTKPVRVIRLVAQHTVEEIILQRATGKLELTMAVIEKGKYNSESENGDSATAAKTKNFAPSELSEMLKYGVEHLYLPDTQEINNISDADLTNMVGDTNSNYEWCSLEKDSSSGASNDTKQVFVDLTKESPTKSKSKNKNKNKTNIVRESNESTEETTESSSSMESVTTVPQSMYVFEGQDYSTSGSAAGGSSSSSTSTPKKVSGFERLLNEAQEEKELALIEQEVSYMDEEQNSSVGKRSRTKRTFSMANEDNYSALVKATSSLSAEELAARKKKRTEAYEAKQQQLEAQRAKRKANELAKKLKEWSNRGYVSYNLPYLLETSGDTAFDATTNGENENEDDEQEIKDDDDEMKLVKLQTSMQSADTPLPILVQALLLKQKVEQKQQLLLEETTASKKNDRSEMDIEENENSSSSSSSSSSWDSEDDTEKIHFESGDVTKPHVPVTENAIIVHVADESGRWGSGGVFSAIDQLSLVNIPLPLQPSVGTAGHWYELAGEMGDLHQGDVHLIEIPPVEKCLGDDEDDDDDDETTPSTTLGRRWIALVIAFKRDRNNVLKLVPSSITTALEHIAVFAKHMNASVHLPRIGHNVPGTDYYAVERIIRSRLKQIETYIYYYSRKGSKSRNTTTSSSSSGFSNKSSSSSSSNKGKSKGKGKAISDDEYADYD